MGHQEVAVILSTFNGENYISEQIESILIQETDSLKISIFIRDDLSSDGTKKILDEIISKSGGKVALIENQGENVGVKMSFWNLVQQIPDEFDVIFFSDQDDIWSENKISRHIQEYEKNNTDVPTGVFSDLWIADANGQSTGRKMSERNHWENSELSTEFLSFDYRVTGAAFSFNQAALRFLRKLNITNIDRVNMHDSFIALLLQARGRLVQINEPLVFYRQHNNNVIGSQIRNRSVFEKINRLRESAEQLIHDDSLAYTVLKNESEVPTSSLLVLGKFYKYQESVNILQRIFRTMQISKYIRGKMKIPYLILLVGTRVKRNRQEVKNND